MNISNSNYLFAQGENIILPDGQPGDIYTLDEDLIPAWKAPSTPDLKGTPISVKTRTLAALPACSYLNGVDGVGATLTANVNGAFPAQDAYTLGLGELLLVANQANPAHNGIYTITNLGDNANKWVLTRANTYDTPSKIYPSIVVVETGNTNANKQFRQTNTSITSIGTSAITYQVLTTEIATTVTKGVTRYATDAEYNAGLITDAAATPSNNGNWWNNVISPRLYLGNFLIVNPTHPNASNSWTRAQALGRLDRPFQTIQGAITASASSDLIMVKPGTYNEALTGLLGNRCLFLDNCTITGNITGTGSFTLCMLKSSITGNINTQTSINIYADSPYLSSITGYVRISSGLTAGGNLENIAITSATANTGAIELYSTTSGLGTLNINNCRLTGSLYAVGARYPQATYASNCKIYISNSYLSGGYSQTIQSGVAGAGIFIRNCIWDNFVFNPENINVFGNNLGCFRAFNSVFNSNYSTRPIFTRVGSAPTLKSILMSCLFFNAGTALMNDTTYYIDFVINCCYNKDFHANNYLAPYKIHNSLLDTSLFNPFI